jgi:hypothetical protein
MRNLIRRILRENRESKVVTMKYYMFDWDDNIMFMPTKIYMKTEDGSEIGMGTEDFAHYRNKLNPKTGEAIEPFEYENETIIGLGKEPFKDFRSGLNDFVKDMSNATLGPAWSDLVEAINSGSYLAIITARGHNPKVLQDALKILIENEYEGISKDSFMNSITKRNRKAGLETDDFETELDDYLESCLFYTVGYYYPTGGIKPEEVKAEAINDFKSAVEELIGYLNDNLKLKGIDEYILKPVFGFSDDDLKNIEFATKNIKDVYIYSTHGGGKKLVKNPSEKEKDIEDELQLENKLRNIIKKIIIYN